MSILCYCVDLSKTIDHAKIEHDIKEVAPKDAKWILIGTKADLCKRLGGNPEEKLKSIQLKAIPTHERIVTSALNKTG
ncbi:Uncharacterised protein [Legionella hackeliae]|uniref:Uncharacterized protein n=1 Tax=Legionella hackeliae TaxID=449 RepID=A0A0A8UX67_LEGHA|nr:hypothetical protein Lhac_2373 [Legionella hackeliae]CEK11692.1 protein of unknown function [Legionella hackeliae]STX48461.1 Uncharacterised protein [Legionella hackeliae]